MEITFNPPNILHPHTFLLCPCPKGDVDDEEKKQPEGEIVYDSATLRLSVKDKIKRLSQTKFEPPSSTPPLIQKKSTSLPHDAKLADSVSG
jgi:hypothetical protein